jgi:hypothetical protein
LEVSTRKIRTYPKNDRLKIRNLKNKHLKMDKEALHKKHFTRKQSKKKHFTKKHLKNGHPSPIQLGALRVQGSRAFWP